MKGKTRFSEKALTKVVNAAAASVPGSVAVTSSWADLGTRSYPRCDIRSDQLAGIIQINSFIAVSWPSPATDIAVAVQRTIISWVSAMTGLRCTQVNVTVEQAVDSDLRVRPEEVYAAAEAPRLRSVRVHRSIPVVSPETARPISVVSPNVARGRPVLSPTTGPAQPLTPTAVPHPGPLQETSVPPAPQLRPVQMPPPTPVRSVSAPSARPVTAARLPVAPRVTGVKAPQQRPARKARPPMPLPLTPVLLPPETPLLPVTLSATPPPKVRAPRVRAVDPVRIRGVRFVPEAEQGGLRRVR